MTTKKISQVQRDVLRSMANGYELVERVYDYCALFPTTQVAGTRKSKTVRIVTLHVLRDAGYIKTEDDSKPRRVYTLTEAGQQVIQPRKER